MDNYHVVNGKEWGYQYSLARGEILRPKEDYRRRKQISNVLPSIRNES